MQPAESTADALQNDEVANLQNAEVVRRLRSVEERGENIADRLVVLETSPRQALDQALARVEGLEKQVADLQASAGGRARAVVLAARPPN